MADTNVNELGLTQESIDMFSDMDPVYVEPDNAGEEPKQEPPAQETPPQKESGSEEQAAAISETSQLKPYWTKLHADISAVDPKYSLPDEIVTGKNKDGSDLTFEQEYDMFRNVLMDVTEAPEYNDPFIQSYLTAKNNEGFDYAKWIGEQANSFAFMNAPDKDLVFQGLVVTNKNENRGWTDEMIQAYVNGLNPIEMSMRADAIRNAYKENDAIRIRNEQIAQQESRKKAIADITAENKEIVKSVFNEVDKLDVIGGIPHGQTDREVFRKKFEALSEINPETGDPFVMELLSDNVVLYKALYLLEAAENGIITNFKEDYKQQILDKTGLSKKGEVGGSTRIAREMSADDYL